MITAKLAQFLPLEVEEVPNYQGEADLVGAHIVCDAMMIAEIRGAIRINGTPHETHLLFAQLLAAAPELYYALRCAIPGLERARELAGSHVARVQAQTRLDYARLALAKAEKAL